MNSLATDTTATAIYEHGMLRLLSPLPLPERTRVKLVIQPIDASDELRRAAHVLAATGLVTAPGAAPSLALGSELRLAETAERYAVGGPLSEVIIAERDAR
jgi:predicted DNA-binding antitoxin AbrB/MazE fold protein